MQLDKFYLRQEYEQIDFYKNRSLRSIVGPSGSGKSQVIYNWLKIGTFQTRFDKFQFFRH